MDFNEHSKLAGKHAFLSASNYHWLNYDDQKLEARLASWQAAARGTALHDFAHTAINLRVKLSKANPTLSMYVNDGIGYKMKTEQPLFYSNNAFGTADCICFRRNTLRIHDLKNGVNKASMKQLEVYAALFCLEYEYFPNEINIELRIYQNGKVEIKVPEPAEINFIMERIVELDAKLEMLKEGAP